MLMRSSVELTTREVIPYKECNVQRPKLLVHDVFTVEKARHIPVNHNLRSFCELKKKIAGKA